MKKLTAIVHTELLSAIANRESTSGQLSAKYGLSRAELLRFVEENKEELDRLSNYITYVETEPTPSQLDDLWISNKFERLKRLQECAEILYQDATTGGLSGADLATSVREFRSYLMLAANELGQLLHRGSGDGGSGDTLSVDISGVDMDSLK